MKWSQIIAPLVAMAIAAIILMVFAMRQGIRKHRYYLATQSQQIARDLIATTNSPLLVVLSPRLREQLASYLSSPTAIEGVRFGDVPAPMGNGQAKVCVFLTNASNQRLFICLEPSSAHDQFDLLGFWFQVDWSATPNKSGCGISERTDHVIAPSHKAGLPIVDRVTDVARRAAPRPGAGSFTGVMAGGICESWRRSEAAGDSATPCRALPDRKP